MLKDITISIKNLRDLGGYKAILSEPYQVRIDRASILGNPFKMFNESQRDLVCNQYRDYFYNQVKTNKAFVEELLRLYDIAVKYGKLELYCWCYPKRCHGETIKEFIQKMLKGE